MRPFTTVQIRDKNTDKMLTHIILYSMGHISASVPANDDPTSNEPYRAFHMTNTRFEEWFSFALFLGHRITVMVRDPEHHIRNVTTF